jgi:hypothetical protein
MWFVSLVIINIILPCRLGEESKEIYMDETSYNVGLQENQIHKKWMFDLHTIPEYSEWIWFRLVLLYYFNQTSISYVFDFLADLHCSLSHPCKFLLTDEKAVCTKNH